MREAFTQCGASCVDDVARCIEIGLADFQMNNVATLCFERLCFHQHFERGLRAEPLHASGEPEFMFLMHDLEIGIIPHGRKLSSATRLTTSYDLRSAV